MPPARRVLNLFGLLLLLMPATAVPARAHAVLLSTTPQDEAILDAAPAEAFIRFNEPVSVLGLSLVGPGGEPEEIVGFEVEGGVLDITLPPTLGRGTHALSWRVMSADGHPIAESILFSIGEPSAAPTPRTNDPVISMALWLGKVLLYIGLFIGAGGAASRAFLAPLPERLKTPLTAISMAGALAALASMSLQGLDALGLGLADAFAPQVWLAAFTTGFGVTALAALAAMLIGIVLMRGGADGLARIGGFAILALTGFAFAWTGHASTASPQGLTRPAVFLHGAAIAFWIGSLAPLFFHMLPSAPHGVAALTRFSRLIPYAVIVLLASGLILASIQTQLSPASFLTRYGMLLAAKLTLVAILFAIAARNRFGLTGAAASGDPAARAALRRNVLIELAIVLVIFGLVAGWRFTPPPRALAQQPTMTTEAVLTHFHNDTDPWGAWVTFEPTGSNSGNIRIAPLGENDVPIEVDDVDVVLSRPEIGVEPFERQAVALDSGEWLAEDIVLPTAGTWQGSVRMRLSAFEETVISGSLFLDAAPPAAAIGEAEIAIELRVAAGALVDRDETIQVRLGQTVSLDWSVDEPQFLHLHGYDMLTEATPSAPVTMRFVANIPGRFAIEAHGRTAGNVAFLEVLP